MNTDISAALEGLAQRIIEAEGPAIGAIMSDRVQAEIEAFFCDDNKTTEVLVSVERSNSWSGTPTKEICKASDVSMFRAIVWKALSDKLSRELNSDEVKNRIRSALSDMVDGAEDGIAKSFTEQTPDMAAALMSAMIKQFTTGAVDRFHQDMQNTQETIIARQSMLTSQALVV